MYHQSVKNDPFILPLHGLMMWWFQIKWNQSRRVAFWPAFKIFIVRDLWSILMKFIFQPLISIIKPAWNFYDQTNHKAAGVGSTSSGLLFNTNLHAASPAGVRQRQAGNTETRNNGGTMKPENPWHILIYYNYKAKDIRRSAAFWLFHYSIVSL